MTYKTLASGVSLKSFWLYAFLVLTSLISVFPFFWMFIVGSNTTAVINQFPPKVVPGPYFLENLQKAMDRSPYFLSYLNSVIISISITASVLLLASLAGFAFAKLRFPFSKGLFVFVLFTMMIPVQLGIIPLYMIMSNLGWVNTRWAVIVPGMVNAFGVFWMRQYIITAVPDELIAAARIDGCNNYSMFFRIVVPIIQPAYATLGILTFMNAWNDFFWPSVVLQSRNMLTVQLALRTLNDAFYQDHSMVLSATFVATLPLLVVFLLFNKRFIAGIAEGALK
jgi:cellobiose transport system permease protein